MSERSKPADALQMIVLSTNPAAIRAGIVEWVREEWPDMAWQDTLVAAEATADFLMPPVREPAAGKSRTRELTFSAEDSKQCEQCGETFYRDQRRALSSWRKRRFCTVQCANRWKKGMAPEPRSDAAAVITASEEVSEAVAEAAAVLAAAGEALPAIIVEQATALVASAEAVLDAAASLRVAAEPEVSVEEEAAAREFFDNATEGVVLITAAEQPVDLIVASPVSELLPEGAADEPEEAVDEPEIILVDPPPAVNPPPPWAPFKAGALPEAIRRATSPSPTRRGTVPAPAPTANGKLPRSGATFETLPHGSRGLDTIGALLDYRKHQGDTVEELGNDMWMVNNGTPMTTKQLIRKTNAARKLGRGRPLRIEVNGEIIE